MAISGFGNTQNRAKLTLNDQASKLKKVELKKPQEDQPAAKPSAVRIGNKSRLDDFSLTRPGDVMIFSNGHAYRHCIDADGNHTWQKTQCIRKTDFESDRGDFRKV